MDMLRKRTGLLVVAMLGIAAATSHATAQKTLTSPASHRLGCGNFGASAFGLPKGAMLLGLTNIGSSTVPGGTVVTYTVQEPGKRPVTETKTLPGSLRPGERSLIDAVFDLGSSCIVVSIVAPQLR